MLEVFGSDYLAFRLLATTMVLVTSGLLFAYMRPRLGAWPALAPSLVLLVFGADVLHVLVGNAITVLLAISCGLAALILVDRDETRGDAAACALLCLGVATYSVAIAFAVGVGVALLAAGRARRVWVAAVPLALYGGWWLWSLGQSSGSEGQLVYSNVLLIPAWSFQATAAALGALSGLDFRFAGSPQGDRPAGTFLALVGIAALAWRFRSSAPPGLLGALAIALALFAIEAVAHTELFSAPFTPRYLYPAAVVVVLVAAEGARSLAWPRPALTALFAVAAVGVATNLALLRNESRTLRNDYAPTLRAELSALELADGQIDPGFDPANAIEGRNNLLIPFAEAAVLRSSPARSYVEAADRYGSLGFGPDELVAGPESIRIRTDAVLGAALGLRLRAAEAPREACRRLTSGSGTIAFALPPAGAVIAAGRPAEVRIGRLAATPAFDLGGLEPGRPAVVSAPRLSAPGRWRVEVQTGALRICER
jgi:hypothetical protein